MYGSAVLLKSVFVVTALLLMRSSCLLELKVNVLCRRNADSVAASPGVEEYYVHHRNSHDKYGR